ncbi:hypothetical protein KIN20_028458 [Parelaphostrongylus tenuis]|uniref:Uncharacterized protein n=1 Tax=Parelaphostrongylus tenuis TaxID=148309 RepID=A0AAD5R148_PARTN|nr:hypothetical protein KIN20_028458 [Parelaphostrongylus tenuis]
MFDKAECKADNAAIYQRRTLSVPNVTLCNPVINGARVEDQILDSEPLNGYRGFRLKNHNPFLVLLICIAIVALSPGPYYSSNGARQNGLSRVCHGEQEVQFDKARPSRQTVVDNYLCFADGTILIAPNISQAERMLTVSGTYREISLQLSLTKMMFVVNGLF